MTGFEHARAVADAVLYEGYLLYPYRRSSGKNRVRWQFGVLVPPAWAREHGLDDTGVAGSAEAAWQRTECLIEARPDTVVHFRVRFLQLQRKGVEKRLPGGPSGFSCAMNWPVPMSSQVRGVVKRLTRWARAR